jgi:hypothetical protein
MSISNLYQSIKSVMPKTVGNDDKFGQDITGAKNPVTQRTIAREGEERAVDKKKSSVLRNVLSKVMKKKAKK